MKVEPNKVINGIIDYADNEVINNLPTVGKWLMGTGIGIATAKVDDLINAVNNNAMAKAMGIVDEDGMYDIDLIAENLKKSAGKYGKMTIELPIIGRMTFSEADVDSLRNYIERG